MKQNEASEDKIITEVKPKIYGIATKTKMQYNENNEDED